MYLGKSSHLELYYDMSEACPHQTSTFTNITANPSVYNEIGANQTHMYYFESSHFTSQRSSGLDRKLVVRLEPCNGIVYLFIRRTRPCWPNPWSCESDICDWAHYQSVINGTADGQPTVLELPLTSTQWFITVYGKTAAKYSLLIVEDPRMYPRMLEGGTIHSKQVDFNTIELTWSRLSSSKQYTVYSSMYFESSETASNGLNPNLLISPGHILDTVCGLSSNTDHPYMAFTCETDECKANVTGLVNKRKYVMNVVSNEGVPIAYAGTLVESLFNPNNDVMRIRNTLESVGITIGSVLLICMATYVWLHSRYHSYMRFFRCLLYTDVSTE